jgi:cytochrome b
MSAPPVQTATVPAWDLPTRVFHWTLVVLIVCAWLSFEFSEELEDPRLVWHRWNGLAILTLMIWRLLWGIAGPPTGRFVSFVRGPRAAWGYARDLLAGTPRHFLGHNPLGALLIIALLSVVTAIATLGLFALEHNDNAVGPLYKYAGEAWAKIFTRWHRLLFEPVLLVLISIHILANVFYAVVKKEPLITAMVTGRKPAGSYEDMDTAQPLDRPALRALFLAFVAATIVFGGISALGGKFP